MHVAELPTDPLTWPVERDWRRLFRHLNWYLIVLTLTRKEYSRQKGYGLASITRFHSKT